MALCVGLMPPALASGTSFNDVPANHWACAAVEAANAGGVMTGTGNRQFSPDKELTVAEFATILTRAFYANEVAASTAAGEWYAKYMDVFNKHELVGSDTRFYTADRQMDRVSMATIMRFVLLDKGIEDPSAAELDATMAKMVDEDLNLFSDDFLKGILVCYNRGLLTGVDKKGTFDPHGTVTRSQTAAIYIRLRDYLKNSGTTIPSAPVETPKPVETQQPEPTAPTGDTTFAFLSGETTVEQMMSRINTATPTYREGYLTNGKPITDANIQEMLGEIKGSMPYGTEWNGDSKYFYNSKLGYGGGCNSFGYAVSDALFGEDAPVFPHKDFTKLKVGDTIWVRDSTSASAASYSHVMVVITAPDAEGTFKTCSGNVNGKVSWPGERAVYTNDIHSVTDNPAFAANSIVWSRY